MDSQDTFRSKMNELIDGLKTRDDTVEKEFESIVARFDRHKRKLNLLVEGCNDYEDRIAMLEGQVLSLQERICRCKEEVEIQVGSLVILPLLESKAFL